MRRPTRNATRERMASVMIAHADLSKDMCDCRNAMRHGTVAATCAQFGVSVSREGKNAILASRRDRLQAVVELLHYSGVNYSIIS